jgi:hypothetical protein
MFFNQKMDRFLPGAHHYNLRVLPDLQEPYLTLNKLDTDFNLNYNLYRIIFSYSTVSVVFQEVYTDELD